MIFLRTQFNRSFDRRFVFTALHKRFTFVHLFYSHLTCTIKPFPFRSIPNNHLLSTKRRFVGSACTAPTEDPPPSYLQHCSTNLFDKSMACLPFRAHNCEERQFVKKTTPIKFFFPKYTLLLPYLNFKQRYFLQKLPVLFYQNNKDP